MILWPNGGTRMKKVKALFTFRAKSLIILRWFWKPPFADVAEVADAADSKSAVAIRAGSSPAIRSKKL